jgi:hypothetical protein
MHTQKRKTVTRLLAVMLGLGGLVGMGICLWTYIQLFVQSGMKFSSTAALFGVFIIIFGWSAWVGAELWQDKPKAYVWAKIIFLLQIPTISVPHFAYQFYTALMLGLEFNRDNDKFGLDFQIASAIDFRIARDIDNLVLGVNLVAVAALIYLVTVSRANRGVQTSTSNT